jgi:hypothetical protein
MVTRWLLLLLSLPPTPSRHRVGVWRKLKRMGAVMLGPAWVLPDTPETLELCQWLVQEVRAFEGTATLARVDRIETMSGDEVARLFHEARAPEYRALIAGLREVLGQLDRRGGARPDSRQALRARLDGLRRELDRIRRIDHLQSPLGVQAVELWETAARRLRELDQEPAARPAARGRRAAPPRGSTWVTRPRPHVDRIASAWLVKRFVDPDATFAFADAADAAAKGIPFDVMGAEFGHQGEDCTFETLLRRFRLADGRLRAIAEIVHEADLQDGKFSRVEAPGVDLAVRALVASTDDDHEALARGMALFDGLLALERPAPRPRGTARGGPRQPAQPGTSNAPGRCRIEATAAPSASVTATTSNRHARPARRRAAT